MPLKGLWIITQTKEHNVYENTEKWLEDYNKREAELFARARKDTLLMFAIVAEALAIAELERTDGSPFANDLYSFAHCVTGLCQNTHGEWRKQLAEKFNAIAYADKYRQPEYDRHDTGQDKY